MSHTKASLIAQANDFINRFANALEDYDALKWRLGSLMVESNLMPDEMYSQVLPASEKMMHVLRQYEECCEKWPEGERANLSWSIHWVLRNHPKRAEWLQMCLEKDIDCPRVVAEMINR